jgi:hypothetical protein
VKSVRARTSGSTKMRWAGALGLSAMLFAALSGAAEISASAAPRMAPNSVLSGARPNGTEPKQAALQAFSDLITPLPGVAPTGPRLVALKTPAAGPYLAVLKNDESDLWQFSKEPRRRRVGDVDLFSGHHELAPVQLDR